METNFTMSALHLRTNKELLQEFLSFFIDAKLTHEISMSLLNEYSSTLRLLKDSQYLQSNYPDIYRIINLILEINRRLKLDAISSDFIFESPLAVESYLIAELAYRRKEVFWGLFLDSQHRLIASKPLFEGTIDSASVYPREVVIEAINLNATAIIFAHNHPSGVAEPSNADRSITKKLINALNLIDVRVLDHFVIGDDDVISFAQRGWV